MTKDEFVDHTIQSVGRFLDGWRTYDPEAGEWQTPADVRADAMREIANALNLAAIQIRVAAYVPKDNPRRTK